MQLAVLGGSSLLSGGFFTKAAILGASVAGSMLLNGRKKPVGKLNDLRVSSASYGRGIPVVWGTMRVTGNMFWATDFREKKVYMTQKGKEKSGSLGKKKSKKGKAQPMYKYYANFAMGLCEGPVDEVIRIWADNNLIYNKLNPSDKDLKTPGFSQRNDDENTGKGSQKSAAGKKGSSGQSGRFAFRFYNGSEGQMPDPFMVQQEGAGNVPGYRGLAYLMFQDFALEDFGNRIPTITVELTTRAESRPMVLTMENMQPPEGGWSTQFTYPQIMDIQRELLYVRGITNSPRRDIIRVYDTTKRKEIRRIDFQSLMPQTCPHQRSDIIGTRTWTVDDAKMFDIHGVTPSGDLIMYKMSGNYGTLLFFDPFANRLIKSWGRSGNILFDGWYDIMAQWGSMAVIGNREVDTGEKYSEGMSIVYERFGTMHVFDDSYNKIATVETDGWRENHCLGMPGSKYGIYFTSVNHGGTNQYRFYTADLTFQYKVGEPVRGRTFEKRIGAWPPVAGAHGNVLIMKYLSYVVGANCLAMIVTGYGTGGGTFLVKMDPITGETLWEKKIDVPETIDSVSGFTHPTNYNNTNSTNFQYNNVVFKIDWRQETVETHRLVNSNTYPPMLGARYYWSERDAHIGFARVEGSASEYQPIIVYNDRKVQTNVDLGKVCEDVSIRAGLRREQIVTTGLSTQEPLNGYMFEQPTEARSILEELANCYQFDAVETDYRLLFKMRGGASLVTIPDTDLGIIESDFGTDNERIEEIIQYQSELPERVTITYYDPKNDYENGSQYFKRPTLPIPVTFTHEHMEVTFNMALLNNYAKSMAKRILYAAWSERTAVKFNLPRDYLRIDPSDTVTLALRDGRNLSVRITDITTGADMMMECMGVYNYPKSYTQTATTEPGSGLVRQPPTGFIPTRPLLFNVPYLADSHEQPGDSFGYYWAAGASKAGFDYGILQSRYAGSNWQVEGNTQLDAIWGYVVGNVAPPPAWNIEDLTTVITVAQAFDYNDPDVVFTWESLTDAEWPSENNMIIIGKEIILFKNAEEMPDGTIRLSHLIRGYRGTINAAYQHSPGEVFAVVHGESIHLGSEELTYLNQEQAYILNPGVAFANLNGQTYFTPDGSTEKPLPVGDVRRVNNSNGSVTFNWSRATRIGGALKNGTGTIPLSEEVERYVVFLTAGPFDYNTWDPDDETKYIWKSLDLSTPTVNIPSATLALHGLTNKSDIHVVIHQMSNEVGYGYPHGLTKYYSLF